MPEEVSADAVMSEAGNLAQENFLSPTGKAPATSPKRPSSPQSVVKIQEPPEAATPFQRAPDATAPQAANGETEMPWLLRSAPADVGLDTRPLEELSQMLQKKVKAGTIPGALCCMVKDNRLVYMEACGYSHLERKLPISSDTIVRLYSNTKNVVAVALMCLIEDGLLSLDDTVAKYIPSFEQVNVIRAGRQAKRAVTIRDLACHTSGLGYGAFLDERASGATERRYQPLVQAVNQGEVKSLEVWCRELAKIPLRSEPGDRWEYGYSTDVLGRILEMVSGLSLDVLLKERVLGPLGMNNTSFAVPERDIHRLSALYVTRKTRGGVAVGNGKFRVLDDPYAPSGSCWTEGKREAILSAGGCIGSLHGGLVTTISDLLRFILMLQNGGELDGERILKKESVEAMTVNALPRATDGKCQWMHDKVPGVGWSLLNTSTVCEHTRLPQQYVVGEYGWGGAAGTHWAVLPKQGLVYACFVPMAMWNETHPVVQAVTKVLHRVLCLAPRVRGQAANRKRPLETMTSPSVSGDGAVTRPPAKATHSRFKQIDGVKYDRDILEQAEVACRDGQVSYPEAQQLWQIALDGPGVTEVEMATLEYAMKQHRFTDKAEDFVRRKLLEITAVRQKESGSPTKQQKAGSAAEAVEAPSVAKSEPEATPVEEDAAVDRGEVAPGRPRTRIQEAEMLPDALALLDRKIKKATDKGETPGCAYAILKDGKLVKANAFGYADVHTRKPWRYDTICRLYSMTKNVAICGLFCLVEDGKVSLDDPVSKFIPAFETQSLQVVSQESMDKRDPENPAPKTAITIQHLVTHTAGLSYGAPLGDEPSCPAEQSYQSLIKRVERREITGIDQWCDEVAQIPLRFHPGEQWEYSYSIDVLGRVMEIISGQPLDEFLRERILVPLGMHDTTFALPESKRSRLATFYRKRTQNHGRGSVCTLEVVDGPASSMWVEPNQSQVLSAGGTVSTISGGLVSTLNDFIRFCLMVQNLGELDGTRVMKPETVQMMTGNVLPEVTGRPDCWCLSTTGLGFGALGSVATQHQDANWYDVPGEFGWGGLAGTAWAVDHREKLVVVSFCQVMYELWIDEDVRRATRKALGYTYRGTIAQRRFKNCPELRQAKLNPLNWTPPAPPPAATPPTAIAPAASAPEASQTPSAKAPANQAAATPVATVQAKTEQGTDSKRPRRLSMNNVGGPEMTDGPVEKRPRRASMSTSSREIADSSATAATSVKADANQTATQEATRGVATPARNEGRSTALDKERTSPLSKGASPVHCLDARTKSLLQELVQETPSLSSLVDTVRKTREAVRARQDVSKSSAGSSGATALAGTAAAAAVSTDSTPSAGAEWQPVALPKALDLLVAQGVCTMDSFLAGTVPVMVEVVQMAPKLFNNGMKSLHRSPKHRCRFSRQEIFCLHCLAFFGLSSPRALGGGELDYLPYLELEEPDVLASLLTYLHAMASGAASRLYEQVEFILRSPNEKTLSEWTHWRALQTPLKDFNVMPEHRRIEQHARGCLQAMPAAFALRGRAAADASGQEALRACLSPEIMVLPLIVQRLIRNEAVVVVGAEQYSVCEGVRQLRYLAAFQDPSRSQQRRGPVLVALDAQGPGERAARQRGGAPLNLREAEQREADPAMEELLRAYTAFRGDPLEDPRALRAVACENWGGSGGRSEYELQALMQWAAASETGRSLEYYPRELDAEDVKALNSFIAEVRRLGDVGVGRLLAATVSAVSNPRRRGAKSLLTRVLERLSSPS